MSQLFLIADDHPLFRSALRQALSQISPQATVLEAESLAGALAIIEREGDIDLVLLDLGLPDSEGFAGLLSIRHQYPRVGVAVVSGHEEPRVMRQAIALGAVAFVPKSAAVAELVHAISAAMKGDSWLPDIARRPDDANDAEQLAQKVASLSPQQYRVLCMVADGKLNKQIAAELSIQESTIKQHVSAVLRKLGLINRTQAGVLLRSLHV